MNFGASIVGSLPLMRANAESLHTDTCKVEREATEWDETEQESVTVWAMIHSSIACHFEQESVTTRDELVGHRVARGD